MERRLGASRDEIIRPIDAVLAAGPLVVALVVFVPFVGLVGADVGISLQVSLIGAIGIVGVAYLAVAYSRGLPIAASFLAFFVLSTFAANLPIGADSSFYAITPGTLGPQIWLAQPPLWFLAGYLFWRGDITRASVSVTEIIFGCFVLWTVITALVGAGPRTDIGLYFSWLMTQALMVIVVVRRGVDAGFVSLKSVVATYSVTLAGHFFVGAAQLLNGGPLGLTFLGEGLSWHPSPIAFEPFFQYQLVPAGFTGHAYVLVALILLVFPSILLFVYISRAVAGALSLAMLILTAVFLRLTESDAGRGALLILVVTILIGTVFFLKRRLQGWNRTSPSLSSAEEHAGRSLLASAVGLCVAVAAVLYPSSVSGSRSDIPTDNSSSQEGGGSETLDSVGSPDGLETNGTAPPDVSGVTDVTVPLFDLSNLGTRLQQYILAIDMFLRYPVFGVGGGNFRFVAASYGLPNKAGLPVPPTIHNVYFMLLAETGLPGFLLYFGAVGSVFLSGIRSWLRANDGAFILAVLIGFVGYFAFMFFTHMIDNIVALLPFWALAGALLGKGD